jgi:hypothetical protein
MAKNALKRVVLWIKFGLEKRPVNFLVIKIRSGKTDLMNVRGVNGYQGYNKYKDE